MNRLVLLSLGVFSLVACGDYQAHLIQGSGSTGKRVQAAGAPSTEATTADEQEVMRRWNVMAEGRVIVHPGDDQIFLLTWEDGAFPHPTYRLGTALAYDTFAKLLVDFMDAGDNLDYLRQTEGLTMTLPDQLGGAGWTFAQLVSDLSTSPFVTADTRAELARIRDLITPDFPVTEL